MVRCLSHWPTRQRCHQTAIHFPTGKPPSPLAARHFLPIRTYVEILPILDRSQTLSSFLYWVYCMKHTSPLMTIQIKVGHRYTSLWVMYLVKYLRPISPNQVIGYPGSRECLAMRCLYPLRCTDRPLGWGNSLQALLCWIQLLQLGRNAKKWFQTM